MSKTIVILGAGFGGIRCALDLARKMPSGWRVVLIDRNPYHVYYPRLYELIMPRKGQGCTIEVKDILKRTRVEFVQGEVKWVDCRRKKVEIVKQGKAEAVEFDYLVLALGAGTDYFGIPGLQEYACTLKSIVDAGMIRKKVEGFLGLHNSPPPSLNLREGNRLDIVIGGAGATGVEVAAELAYLLRGVERKRWSITMVEALPRILSMFPNELSQYAHTRLEKLGVKLMLDTCIKKVAPTARHPEVSAEGSPAIKNNGILRAAQNDSGKVEVVLTPRPLQPGENEKELVCDFLPEHEKRVRTDLLVWTGGVRANPLLASCGMAVDRKGRLEVDEHLQVKGMEGMFAIGDNAFLMDPQTKQPVPATAQAALSEAKIAADNVVRAIKGTPLALYQFPKFSAIVPLAGRDGVALVGDRVVRGFFAWLLRQAADCRYFASIVGWWKAVQRCILK